ncbi:hypothetical protein HDE70_002352 [Pedobacter cryoconitis]|nr:hypothetical protein [Pedobacter cryoconitis]
MFGDCFLNNLVFGDFYSEEEFNMSKPYLFGIWSDPISEPNPNIL